MPDWFWIFFWCGGWEVACLFVGIAGMIALNIAEASHD
jgi:hypothetical protein